nr:hypothetical protein [Bacteroidota bacterium]
MINPYLDYNTFSPTIIQSLNYGAPNITSPPFLYDWSQPPINGGYTGEYMITMQDHFWRIAYPNNALSYKVEVVGFPFTMSCWDQPQSCAYPISPLSTRDMYMPDDSYNSVTKKWNNLVNVRSNGEFTGDIGGSFIPEVLVSKFFLNAVVFNLPSRNILSHTVTKHTIYLHCGSSTNDGVISQFSFYYDNTRGRMRNYPFEKDNAPGSTSSCFWDVIFRPELMIAPVSLFHNTDKYFFDEPDNSDWITGGSINYFPLAENTANASCNIIVPLSSDEFAQLIATYSGQPQDFGYYKHFAPPYSLYDVTLRCTYGNLLAGYELNSSGELSFQQNSSTLLGIYEGLRHTYHIDQNIDLTIINPSEQTIYNPSEVEVTASDLHFPSYYTFKTIRGVYPTIANVTADNNDPQTGGPYADPRDVPVRTDLRSENANDPQDPNTPWHSVYSSRYYLKEGSKLTIEPCANIFDATFDVEEGATLLFEIQQYNLGFEHKNLNQTQNLGRYKIKRIRWCHIT